MKRQVEVQEETSQDSFLDVVANLVGVIIILVMLVGSKVTNEVLREIAPERLVSRVEPAKEQELAEQVQQARRKAQADQTAIQETATKILQLDQETEDFDAQRVELAMHRQIVEEDMARRRDKLSAEQQREFDVQRKIAECQLKLDELTKEQLALFSGPETVEEIESVPTPLAREVDGDAIHLRLKNGLVSVVPFKELIEEVQYHVDDIRRRLVQQGQVVDTFGPIEGYRIRMTVIQQVDADSVGGPRAGQVQRINYDQFAEVLPTSESIGQDVELALAPGGSLYTHLQAQRGKVPTVVVWLYSDSFDQFRLLKRTLWEMGYSLATRPLEPGTNIGASPHGTKSAAQ